VSRIFRALAATALCLAGLLTGLPVAAAAPQTGPVAHFLVLGARYGSLDAAREAVKAAGGTVLVEWPQIGVLEATSDRTDFAQAVRESPGVLGAGASRALAELTPRSSSRSAGDTVEQPQYRAAAAGRAADEPLGPQQWDMRAIKADQAQAISEGSPDVVVGVLDSGVDATHPDLASRVDPSRSAGCTNQGIADPSTAAWSPSGDAHGTHVAGTIAAARNGIGIAGVAPGVRVASVKVVDDNGFIYPEYAICGYLWAAEHGLSVTNNSYFIDPWFLWCGKDSDQRDVAAAIQRALAYAGNHNVVTVAALGNSNWDLAKPIDDTGSPDNGGTPVTRHTVNCLNLPAEGANVVGVSSVGVKSQKSYYSNYGLGDTDVTAPGGDQFQIPDTSDANGRILSTVPGGGYAYMQGTSMASPHAAGVVALIRGKHPEWPASQVIAALHAQADPLACPPGVYDPTGDGRFPAHCSGGQSGTGFYGAGLIDALDAVTK
jgi:subtilisin family serine protease